MYSHTRSALRIKKAQRKTNMKRIFIDCGTNLGQGFESFKQKYEFDDTWDIYLFEPNPHLRDWIAANILNKNKNLRIYFFNGAVTGAKNSDEKEFYLHADDRVEVLGIKNDSPIGGGSTLMLPDQFKDGEMKDYEKCIVETLQLSKLLIDIIKPYSEMVSEKHVTIDCSKCYVVVKLDVEGEEYNIIEDLLVTGAAWGISDLHVEFHGRRFKEDKRADEVRLIGELFQCGVTCYPHH